MSDVLVIARLALQEAIRRRVLLVVAVLTVGSGVLYFVGCLSLKHHVGGALEVNNGILKPTVPATLLGEIGRSFGATTLTHIAAGVAYALPFEAMYRDALNRLSPGGPLAQLVQLGPLGGARGGGVGLWVYAVAYVAGCAALAAWAFR